MSDEYARACEERARTCEALVPRVVEVFNDAWKRHQPPSDGDCRRIANYLVNMRAQKEARPQDYYYREKLIAARRAGERFLAALEAVEDPAPNDKGVAGMPVLELSEACRQIRWIMRCLGETDHPIKFLDDQATAAWGAVNDGKSPRSREADKSPRVAVVVALCELAGTNISHSMVSKILKGERHRGTR